MESLQFTEFKTHEAKNARFEIGLTVPHSATLGEALYDDLGIRDMLHAEGVDFERLNKASRIDADFGAWGLVSALADVLKPQGVTVHIIRSKLSRVIADVGRKHLRKGMDTVFGSSEHFKKTEEIHAQALGEYLSCIEAVKEQLVMLLDVHTMADHSRKEPTPLTKDTINDGSYENSWLDPDRTILREINFVHDSSGGGQSPADRMMQCFQQVFREGGHNAVPNKYYDWNDHPYTAHRSKELVPAFNMIDFPKGLLANGDYTALADLSLDVNKVMALAQLLARGIGQYKEL